MDFDIICEQMSSVTIQQKVNDKLIADLNLIITEIIKMGNFNIDIYELCVNCGHSLTWDQEYNVNENDIMWLKTTGKLYFCESLNNYIKIDTVEKYNLVLTIYKNLIDLFSLQVE